MYYELDTLLRPRIKLLRLNCPHFYLIFPPLLPELAVFLNFPTPPNIWMTELALTDSLMMPPSISSSSLVSVSLSSAWAVTDLKWVVRVYLIQSQALSHHL